MVLAGLDNEGKTLFNELKEKIVSLLSIKTGRTLGFIIQSVEKPNDMVKTALISLNLEGKIMYEKQLYYIL